MSKWSGRTKGFVLGYQFFIFIIKNLGVRISYILLYFVVPFYFIFLHQARQNLYLTFKRVPDFSSLNLYALIYSNFSTLGKTLIDNLAVLTHHKKKYSYVGTGSKYLLELFENSQPAILISAHIGSWNVAGELIKAKGGTVNIVMYDGENRRIKELIQENIGVNNYKVILVKNDLSHLFKIKNAIEKKELICIHADRYIEGHNTIEGNFFDNIIKLPQGPFAIAAKLNVPYSFVFCLKKGTYEYQFSATKPQISRDENIIVSQFLEILEEKLIRFPEQWFNYFNIFEFKKKHDGY